MHSRATRLSESLVRIPPSSVIPRTIASMLRQVLRSSVEGCYALQSTAFLATRAASKTAGDVLKDRESAAEVRAAVSCTVHVCATKRRCPLSRTHSRLHGCHHPLGGVVCSAIQALPGFVGFATPVHFRKPHTTAPAAAAPSFSTSLRCNVANL